MSKTIFTYDDVYLRPKHSSLESRSHADTSVSFLGRKFKLPVVPANMKDVISFKNAEFLSKNDYFYIMHRFDNQTEKFVEFALDNSLPYISISTGVGKESYDELGAIFSRFGESVVDCITIDVAHAHHDNVKKMVNYIKDFKFPKIIAGNVATSEGYRFLGNLGVDAVKVGIGSGKICTTKLKTGFHLPIATSIWECSQGGSIPIIADGGAVHYGDVAKALCLGATMVMSGSWFASCVDSPAMVFQGKKIYRGSTSYEAKGENRHIEGKTLEIEEGCKYSDRLEEIRQAISSSISYAGGRDLSSFKSVEWQMNDR